MSVVQPPGCLPEKFPFSFFFSWGIWTADLCPCVSLSFFLPPIINSFVLSFKKKRKIVFFSPFHFPFLSAYVSLFMDLWGLSLSVFVYIDNNCIDRYAHRRALADTESKRLHRTILLLLLFQYWNFRNAIDDFLCRLIIMIIIFVFAISPRLYVYVRVCVCVCCCVVWVCVCVWSLCGFWQPSPEAFLYPR